MSYLVGSRIDCTVTIADKASGAIVDPATLLITLAPPASSGYAKNTYAWNGAVWTSSEAIIGTPSRTGTGSFLLHVTIPYANLAAGKWIVGWKSTANVAGLGEGSGEDVFLVLASAAIA
jgi:hypothetical protein